MIRSSDGRGINDFGGPWTEVKLDVVQEYLKVYTGALKAHAFELTYVDAFAGSGDRLVEVRSGGLLEGRPEEVSVTQMAGSAMRALDVEPPFSRYVFNEHNRQRFLALEGLRRARPDRNIECFAEVVFGEVTLKVAVVGLHTPGPVQLSGDRAFVIALGAKPSGVIGSHAQSTGWGVAGRSTACRICAAAASKRTLAAWRWRLARGAPWHLWGLQRRQPARADFGLPRLWFMG